MKTLVSLLSMLLVGCTTTQPTFPQDEGSSREQPVVIRGVRDTQAGIAAENAWIRERYPSARKTGQRLESAGDKIYDVITFKTADGQTRGVYFDITEFFGK